MDLALFKMQNGDFGVKYSPKAASLFYAVGDNIEELVDYGLGRISRAKKSSAQQQTNITNHHCLDDLRDAGIDQFGFFHKSLGGSKSEYLTHVPTGTKFAFRPRSATWVRIA